MTTLPKGFRAHVTNIGVKDHTDDFTVVACDHPCSAAGVFTQSSFAGPSVLVSRHHVADGRARAMVVVSKNANVATGAQGLADAEELAAGTARALGCATSEVLVASTGVIGRAYPMDRIRAGLAAIPNPLPGAEADDVARGIMTTDTVAKVATATLPSATGSATVVGVAKGVGMIEPNMATMIAIVLTDAAIEPRELRLVFRRVVDRSFNCVSVDSDTSTSDTAVVLASGDAGTVDVTAFEAALLDVCSSLARQIARDGEGATKLLEVHVDGALDTSMARRVAKAIVNSPLVKTAVHGADPNWGRVAMAVGKSTTSTEVRQDHVVIRFGDQEVYPARVDDGGLQRLAAYMRGSEVRIHVSLATAGTAAATVWGCDLSDGYVRINADYTT